MIRYNVSPSALDMCADGDFVKYEDARRDIGRLVNELFAVRVAYKELEAQRRRDLKVKDDRIDRLEAAAHRAAFELGYADSDPDKGRT